MALPLLSPQQGRYQVSRACSHPTESTAATPTAPPSATPTTPRRAFAASALARGLALAGEGVGAYVAKRGFHGVGLATATTASASCASCTAASCASCAFIARPAGGAVRPAWPSPWRRRPLRQGGARTPTLTAFTAIGAIARVYAARHMLARWGLQLVRPELFIAIRL